LHRRRDHRPVLATFKVQWGSDIRTAKGFEEIADESGLVDAFNVQADFAGVDFVLWLPSGKVHAADGAIFQTFS
jgi:hypothetical protein